jgi:hypothetical protein
MGAVAVAADMVGHPEKLAGPWGVPALSRDVPSAPKLTSCETQWGCRPGRCPGKRNHRVSESGYKSVLASHRGLQATAIVEGYE